MKKILLSLTTLVAVSALVITATRAYFSDTETSTDNTFSAGSIDLNVDGANTNSVKFTISNMKPGDQPTRNWTLSNVGTINGYLDLENILVTSQENDCLEPESEAGDTTCTPSLGSGELQDVINLRLYLDKDKDGYWSTGDIMIYNGKLGNIAGNYDQNELIAVGSDVRINAVVDWWSTGDDNKAMGDGATFDMTFELGQTTGQ